jgi:hypothetical protein
MSKIRALFILSPAGELEINKPEVRKVPEFRVLFDRDTGSRGDSDGRKKYIATAELYYIYLVHDIRSLYSNLDLEARKERARVDANLPANWKEDTTLNKAVEVYKDLFKLSADGSAYIIAERLYYTTTKDVEYMIDSTIELKTLLLGIMNKLKGGPSTKLGDVEKLTLAGEAQAIIKQMTVNQKSMLDNAKQFDSLSKLINQLALNFLASEGSLKTPVGGGEINEREV